MEQVKLQATLDKIEEYVQKTRYKLKLNNKKMSRTEKLIQWFLSWKGTMTTGLATTMLVTIPVSLYFEISFSDIQGGSLSDQSIFLFVCMSGGWAVVMVILNIAMIFDILGIKVLLRQGFEYLKQDSADLMKLNQILMSQSIKELLWVQMLLKTSPPNNMFTEPLKKSFGFVFSISIIGVMFTFLINTGGELSLLKKLEPMVFQNLPKMFLILEIALGALLMLVAYYKLTAHLYEQKIARVIAILEGLITYKQKQMSGKQCV